MRPPYHCVTLIATILTVLYKINHQKMGGTHSYCVLLALGSPIAQVVADSVCVSPSLLWVHSSNGLGQYFFNNTDFVNQVASISSACSTAMQASIACDPYLRDVMTSDYYGPVGTAKHQDSFCSPSCGNGLSTYRSAVLGACSKDPDPLPGLPATHWVDSATAAWTQLCLKDSSTGDYCVGSSAISFMSGSFSPLQTLSEPSSPIPLMMLTVRSFLANYSSGTRL